MNRKVRSFIAITSTVLSFSVCADVLELKNGDVMNGKYAGGTSSTVRFETSAGMQVLTTSQLVALTFTTPPAPAPATPPPAPTPAPAAPAPQAKSVTLPSGTMLLVRMMDGVSSRNGPGANFTTKLEYNLVVDGTVAVPAGTVIYGKVQSATQARRAVGRSTLDIRLAQMVIKGTPAPISTTNYKAAGQASIAKAAKGAAAGAAIGGIVDGGDGAGKGAAIGATAGALTRGQTITITPGTLLEFTLTQPVTLTVTN